MVLTILLIQPRECVSPVLPPQQSHGIAIRVKQGCDVYTNIYWVLFLIICVPSNSFKYHLKPLNWKQIDVTSNYYQLVLIIQRRNVPSTWQCQALGIVSLMKFAATLYECKVNEVHGWANPYQRPWRQSCRQGTLDTRH